jgi:prepilin-type N-terminal cleavage/methylation domain-containing protein
MIRTCKQYRGKETSAFTLVELLVVIAIIAVLASLIVGLAGVAGRKGREGRVRTELQQLVTGIERYKADLGQYPPDNVRGSIPENIRPGINPLYYELTGVIVNNQNASFQVPGNLTTIQASTVQDWFNRGGFLHASTDPKEVKPYVEFKSSQVRRVTNPHASGAETLEILAVPVDSPKGSVPFGTTNPWRYVSTSPTNNPSSFDLWAEIVVGKTTNIIGNWKE